MEDIILVGYGGHAKSVADCIERQGKYHIAGYTDSNQKESPFPYLGTDDELQELYAQGIRNAAICIGYLGHGDLRDRLYAKLKAIGYSLPVLADPTAAISQSASIGEGSFVGKYAVVNAEARIGSMAIINTHAIIEHECVVGDYTHVAVGAVLCGAASVGAHCLIGANATVLQTVQVGSHSIIAAGTVAAKDIGENRIMRNKKYITELNRQSGGVLESLIYNRRNLVSQATFSQEGAA